MSQPIGQIFLLLFMLVIPLFSALVIGIAEMGDIGSLKRVVKTLAFTVGISGRRS
jgi:DAACS family dicarboxylate/amino acid:cation (Na+ or H+) symporter